MKTFTTERRAAIECALKTAPTAAAAVHQLTDKPMTKDQLRTATTELKRDCFRLGLGAVYKERFKVGRKARTP